MVFKRSDGVEGSTVGRHIARIAALCSTTRGSTTQPCAVALQISRIAARLFAAKGYDATPVREIVEAAGVTKPTLYYHFGSKEGLAQTLLTVPLTGLQESLRATLESASDPLAGLVGVVEAHFAFCRYDPDRARFYYALCFGPHGSSALAEELSAFSEGLAGQVSEAVRRLADAGLVSPERIGDCAQACRGIITMATIEFLYGGGELGPGLAERLVRDLLWGFGPRESGTRGS
jgi:AcrR family transcriptional regulator